MKKADIEKIISLVDDLYWDWDRISTSGQESLDEISKTLKMYNHVDIRSNK